MQACILAECLYRFIQVFHHLFSHCPRRCTPVICSSHGLAGWREERTQPSTLNIVQVSSPHSPRKAPRVPHLCTCIHPVFVQCQKRRVREPASQPNMQIPQFTVHTSPTPTPSSSSSQSHSFFIQLRLHLISYIPPAPFCTCVKYCLLVVFHAAMYFSMQLV
jgi:hypothetical protein